MTRFFIALSLCDICLFTHLSYFFSLCL